MPGSTYGSVIVTDIVFSQKGPSNLMANNSRSPRWRIVPDILLSCAELRPHVPVLAGTSGQSVTAAQLLERSRRGAQALAGHGIRRGDFVGVDTTSMGWMDVAVAYFSVVWLGAAAVMLMGEDSERAAGGQVAMAAVISAGAHPLGAARPVPIADLAGCPQLAGTPAAAPGDLLDIVFTSGTTGVPKPVAATHAQWADPVRPEIMASRGRRTVAHTGIPIAVSGGLHGVLLAHLARGVTSLHARTTGDLVAGCRRTPADELHLTPHAARALTRTVPPGEPWAARVTIIRAIGGQVPADVAAQLSERFPRARVVSLYGLTEGGAALCMRLAGREDQDSIGRPVEGTEVRVVDPAGQELGPGQVGEVMVRVTGKAALAYYGEDALNRDRFSDGWVRTGDLGMAAPDGTIRLVGRDKEMIVLRGGRIRPEAVEEILSRHVRSDVEFTVVGVAGPNGWDGIAVFLAGEAADPAVADARQRFAGLKGPFRPQVVRVVPEIPRAAFGKPLRRVLAEALAAEG